MKKFSAYFNQWLYSKDAYYAKYRPIGKQGDFYTAVSTSSFFGGAIANKILDLINNKTISTSCNILEIGSHHGYLMADIIQFIYTFKPNLLKTLTFCILEKHEALQKQQEKYLKESFSNAINLVFYSSLEEIKLNEAFIISNEIFDAFSCELIYKKEQQYLQAFVDKNHIVEFLPCTDKNILQMAKKYKISKGEVPISYKSFIQKLCTQIKHFEFITFDYGEKYARNDFSLRIYEKHQVFPFFDDNIKLKNLYQKSDITYDVNFSILIDLFKEEKVKNIKYCTQASALIEFRILELLEILENNSSEKIYLQELQKVKLLLECPGMGDRFKMLHISK